jgi:hypothetical protein
VTLPDIVGFVAAFLGGVGGCLLGARAADSINRKLGRGAPLKEPEQEEGS